MPQNYSTILDTTRSEFLQVFELRIRLPNLVGALIVKDLEDRHIEWLDQQKIERSAATFQVVSDALISSPFCIILVHSKSHNLPPIESNPSLTGKVIP